MKINTQIPHGKIGHMCHGGCAGYAQGGEVSQDAKDLADIAASGEELAADPEMIQAAMGQKKEPWTIGKLFGEKPLTPEQIEAAHEAFEARTKVADKRGVLSNLGDAMIHGPGIVPGQQVLGGFMRNLTDPDTSYAPIAPMATGKIKRMSEGGMVGDEDNDPAIIPEDIKEFVKAAHKERQESRPDESWRITPAEKPAAVDAPYKRDEEDMEAAQEDKIPNYDEGGVIPNQDLQDIADVGGAPAGMPRLAPAPPDPLAGAPTDEGPGPNEPPAPAPVSAPAQPAPMAPAPTDATYMDRANKLLGLGPDQQAGLMKVLGDRTQTGQIGAGIAGIGDAIASGGTLGKVNPGGLGKSEEMLQNKTKEGIEGMQTIRGNQEKSQELADKLQSRDPNSPLSKYAQKTYGQLGKKIGLDLSHAPASLIADVTGKGVEALNTEFNGQLKTMGVQLQGEQVDATKSNQKAERQEAETARQTDAAKTLASQGLVRKGLNQLTSSGRTAQKALTNTAEGVKSFNSVEEAENAGLPVGTRVSIGGRMATIK